MPGSINPDIVIGNLENQTYYQPTNVTITQTPGNIAALR